MILFCTHVCFASAVPFALCLLPFFLQLWSYSHDQMVSPLKSYSYTKDGGHCFIFLFLSTSHTALKLYCWRWAAKGQNVVSFFFTSYTSWSVPLMHTVGHFISGKYINMWIHEWWMKSALNLLYSFKMIKEEIIARTHNTFYIINTKYLYILIFKLHL